MAALRAGRRCRSLTLARSALSPRAQLLHNEHPNRVVRRERLSPMVHGDN